MTLSRSTMTCEASRLVTAKWTTIHGISPLRNTLHHQRIGVTSISRRGRPTTRGLNVGAVNEPIILFGILAARIEIGDGSSLASSMSIYHRVRVLPAGK